MTKVISITTNKGGVGKSFFSSHLSLALARKYKVKVLLVELMSISTKDIWLGMNDSPDLPGLVGLIKGQGKKISECIIKREDCDLYLSRGSSQVNDLERRPELFEKLINIIIEKSVFDLIIFDGSNCGLIREGIARNLSNGFVVPLSFGDGLSLHGSKEIIKEIETEIQSDLIALAVTYRSSDELSDRFQLPFIEFIDSIPKEKVTICEHDYVVDEASFKECSVFDLAPNSKISQSLYQLSEIVYTWMQNKNASDVNDGCADCN